MEPLERSRREFFRYMALLGIAGFSAVPLQAAKIAPPTVQYQETPKNGQKCMDCMHFLPETNECKLVAGTISPEGWCRLFILPPDKR